MPPFMHMCAPHHRGPIINQRVYIQQPRAFGGLGGFLMGLAGGVNASMYGMPIFNYGVPYRDAVQFQYYAQQMQFQQMSQMQYYPMMPMPQMSMVQNPQFSSPCSYLNQMPQQMGNSQLSMNGMQVQDPNIANLNTLFEGKNYKIFPEYKPNGETEYVVLDNQGTLLAQGTYQQVRETLLEKARNDIEIAADDEDESVDNDDDVDDVDDVDDSDNDDNSADVDDNNNNVPTSNRNTRTQRMPQIWHSANEDANNVVKNMDLDRIKQDAQGEQQSCAKYIVSRYILESTFKGCLNKQQINDLTSEFIHFNQDCFNSDGSLKSGANLSMLAIPNSEYISQYIIGNNTTEDARLNDVKTHVTVVGNLQYDANIMAQHNCKESAMRNVYINERSNTYVYYFSNLDKQVQLPEVRGIDSDGNWVDRNGTTHNKADLEKLAEQKLEDIQAADGNVQDNTNLYDTDE